jgi:hypothetical protein
MAFHVTCGAGLGSPSPQQQRPSTRYAAGVAPAPEGDLAIAGP